LKVSNWKSINKNSLIGSFDLELSSGFFIQGAMLLGKEGRQWISFPGIPMYKDNQPMMKDGKQQYRNVFSIPDRERRDKFSEQVISVLQSAGHL